MSHFSESPNHVRVDIWKPSGKWYDAIMLVWPESEWGRDRRMHATFRREIDRQQPGRFRGMIATCLEPYHELSHPIMIVIGEEGPIRERVDG